MTTPRDLLVRRAHELIDRREELARAMADPEVLGDASRLAELAQEHSDIGPAVEAGHRYLRLLDQLEQARELARGDDDLAELAVSEAGELEEELAGLEGRLRWLVVPRDPLDDRPAVMEIRAGTGGDEAALFAGDLHRMYTRYASGRGWTLEPVSFSEGSAGGFKEVVFVVRGRNAYGCLRYESGVHRVQRVPEIGRASCRERVLRLV